MCYEGSALLTVLAGSVSINGYRVAFDNHKQCLLEAPSGFPCHAVHSAGEPLIPVDCSLSLPGACHQDGKTSDYKLKDQQQLMQHLYKLITAGEQFTSVVQLEENTASISRLLSGTCGLGQFYSVCTVCVINSPVLYACTVVTGRI